MREGIEFAGPCGLHGATPRMAPDGSGTVLARRDRLDDAGAEHQAVEQRVRREPVRAVHAAARGLAARPRAREVAGAVEVGHDAAGQVVRGGRDRQEVVARVEADGRAPTARSSGNRSAKSRIPVASSHMWSGPRSMQRRVIARGDDIARREVGERVLLGHEREAVVVAQDRALAPQRLGEQQPRARRASRARWGGTA